MCGTRVTLVFTCVCVDDQFLVYVALRYPPCVYLRDPDMTFCLPVFTEMILFTCVMNCSVGIETTHSVLASLSHSLPVFFLPLYTAFPPSFTPCLYTPLTLLYSYLLPPCLSFLPLLPLFLCFASLLPPLLLLSPFTPFTFSFPFPFLSLLLFPSHNFSSLPS